MISVHFQSKPFKITVIQAYSLTSNAEEAEIEWFYEDLQYLLELTPQKRCFFHYRGLECKSRKSRDTWSNRQARTQNEAGQRWPKGSKASCEVWRKDQGLLSRSGRKRSPQSCDDGGFSRAAAPVWGFSRGMTGSSGSLSCGASEVRCPCAWRGGACHCSRVMVGESVLKTR